MRPWKDEPRELDDRDFELMGLPRRHWETSLEKVVDEGDPSPRSVTRRYLDHLEEMCRRGHGLFYWGPNETGKSAAAAHVAKAYRRRGQSVLFARSEMIRRATLDDVYVAGRDLWKRAKAADVLVVDDLGKEHEGGTGYARSQLDLLLRERYGDGMVTLYTTNLRPGNIDSKLKDSTINLVTTSSTAVQVEGANHRTDQVRDVHDMLLGA